MKTLPCPPGDDPAKGTGGHKKGANGLGISERASRQRVSSPIKRLGVHYAVRRPLAKGEAGVGPDLTLALFGRG